MRATDIACLVIAHTTQYQDQWIRHGLEQDLADRSAQTSHQTNKVRFMHARDVKIELHGVLPLNDTHAGDEPRRHNRCYLDTSFAVMVPG